MNCGSPVRPPPRRPVTVGRLASALCLVLLALAFSAGPANAYPCGGSSGPVRTLAGHTRVDVNECTPAPKRQSLHRKADPISFAFFIGLIVAVLLVPVARLSKREYASRE
jgi:hypothetical protein